MNEQSENLPDEELSSLDCPLRFLARITLELETPMHIGSGQDWDESDAGVVLDANGLPTLPLTGIIGILRHAFATGAATGSARRKAANSLFGYQGKKPNGEGIGQGSRLRGSFGCIHDADNTPVYGLLEDSTKLQTDQVLAAALRLTLRDHARHNESGVAADKGKFDELVVCAGHRFTFELELIGKTGADETHWKEFVSLLADPLTRIGGKSRRGLGRFKVIRVLRRTFDLANGGFEDYANYNSRLDVPIDAAEIHQGPDVPPGKWESVTLEETQPLAIIVSLKPRFFWMFGAGSDLEGDSDRAAVRDQRIVWTGDVPEVRRDVLYLPGSGFKGGLRHRAWFHAQAKYQSFAEPEKARPVFRAGAQRLVTALLGNEWNADEADLQPGILYPDDHFEQIGAKVAPLQNHNSIDRFTSGAQDALLFDEKPLWRSGENAAVKQKDQPGLRFTIQLARKLTQDEAEVLGLCLDDLSKARLSIGGGFGRGNGFCDGGYVAGDSGEPNSLSAVTQPAPTTDTP